jgi:hypothetical protein
MSNAAQTTSDLAVLLLGMRFFPTAARRQSPAIMMKIPRD